MPNRSRRAAPSSGHRYPRSARVSETLREIIADELVRIDDERLAFVTITKIDVDNELNRAIVYFDSLAGDEADAEIIEALDGHRRRIQASINRQIRAKKTPVLDFRPDEVIRAAERIDGILRADRAARPVPPSPPLDAPTDDSFAEPAAGPSADPADEEA
jgi:ribosome-binding factor A